MCYGCYDDNDIIGFIGVLHFPHPVNKKIKSISRLVVLPDYQGIGIGHKFLNVVADIYAKQGYDVKIVTSAKNLIMALKNDSKWMLTRYSAVKRGKEKESFTRNLRTNVKTASFYWRRKE